MNLKKNNSYFKNTVSNFVGNFALVMIMMVATPMLIRSFGDTQYALWRISMLTVLSYVVFFDAGINSSIKRNLIDAVNEGDEKKSKEVIGISVIFYGTVGLLAIAVVSLLSLWLPNFINTPDNLKIPFAVLIVATGIYAALNFFQSIFSAIFAVFARYDILQILQILGRAMSMFGIFIFIGFSIAPLYSASIAAVLTPCILIVLSYILVKSLWSGFGADFSLKNLALIKNMFVFSGWSWALMLGPILINQTQPVIIGQMMTLPDATFYAVPFIIITQLNAVVSATTSAIFPIANKHKHNGETEQLQRVYSDCLKRSYWILLSFAIPLCVFGGYFFKFWINPEFFGAHKLLYILSLNIIALPLIYTTNIILTAVGEIKVIGLYSVLSGILAIILSYLFLIYTDFGLYGIALAMGIPYIIRGIFATISLRRQIGMGILQDTMSLLWIIPVCCAGYFVSRIMLGMREPQNLFETLAYLGILFAILVIIGAFTIAPRSDKGKIGVFIGRIL